MSTAVKFPVGSWVSVIGINKNQLEFNADATGEWRELYSGGAEMRLKFTYSYDDGAVTLTFTDGGVNGQLTWRYRHDGKKLYIYIGGQETIFLKGSIGT